MIEFEELDGMLEKFNASAFRPRGPRRFESAEKTKGDILAFCELQDASDELYRAFGKSIAAAEYERIKKRVYNALVNADAILNPPALQGGRI